MDESLLFPQPRREMAPNYSQILYDDSDADDYDDLISTPPSVTSSSIAPYRAFSIWKLLRGAATNFLIPFINGMMLGFGELFAYQLASGTGWSITRVGGSYHSHNLTVKADNMLQMLPFRHAFRPAGPGLDIEAPREPLSPDRNRHLSSGHRAASPPEPPRSPSGGFNA